MRTNNYKIGLLKISKLVLGIALLVSSQLYAQTSTPAEAAKNVIRRLLKENPAQAENFQFSLIPMDPATGNDVFQISASGGSVIIEGSSVPAMCRGVYDYLKKDCKAMISWEGDQLNLPNPLPSTTTRKIVSPVKWRNYLQVCHWGYSAPFWDWKRWEREIDWAALHGINLMLSSTGQEKILQTVLLKHGFSDTEIRSQFFSGPAILPWFRMGNLYSSYGPLPQSHIDSMSHLQVQILARQRELQINGVTPAFSGFVPTSWPQKFPSSRYSKVVISGFGQVTTQVRPEDPMFATITKDFITEYKRVYGQTSSIYSLDQYNEIHVTFDTARGEVATEAALQAALSSIGGSTYAALKAADSGATWVSMAWLFAFPGENHPISGETCLQFWTKATQGYAAGSRIAAFLGPIPKDKLLILDLSADDPALTAYDKVPNLDKNFVWSMTHSFGGRNYLHGNFNVLAARPFQAKNTLGNRFVGMSVNPEGINNNSVTFEFMLDMMWLNASPNPRTWITDYAKSRYGVKTPAAESAAVAIWNSVLTNVLTWQAGNYQVPLHGNPRNLTITDTVRFGNGVQSYAAMRKLILDMLAAPVELKNDPLFVYDLIDISKGYFGERASFILAAATTGPMGSRPAERLKFDNFAKLFDSLLANVPSFRVDGWTKMARDMAPVQDKPFYERDSKSVLMNWFGDYCHRYWSGLTDYYRQRWNAFLNGGNVGAVSNLWLNTSNLVSPNPVAPTAVAGQVIRLLGITDPSLVVPIQSAAIKPELAELQVQGATLFLNIPNAVPFTLDLYSSLGNQLFHTSGMGRKKNTWDISHLPNGVVFAVITVSKNRNVHKIVLNVLR